jgi:hypothetical protein
MTEQKATTQARFQRLPAGVDPDRVRTEKDARPDPTADAVAQREFVERSQG